MKVRGAIAGLKGARFVRVPLQARRFVLIDKDFVEDIGKFSTIDWKEVSDDLSEVVVKVRIRVSEIESNLVDPNAIRAALLSRVDKPHYVYPIQVDVVKSNQSSFVEKDEAIFGTPREEFARFVRDKSPTNKELIIELGEELFLENGL